MKIYGVRDFIVNLRSFFQIIILTMSSSKDIKQYDYNISLVAVMRNEAFYLEEWISYYNLLGINHFYIYDNKSSDNTKYILEKYIESGLVSYTYVNADNHPQSQCYTDAIFKYRNKSKYMLFVDVDEFVVNKTSNSFLSVIDNLFEKNSKIAGIGLNWLCFGSSNIAKRPDTPVIGTYLYRSDYKYPANSHIKTILNPRKIIRGGVHCPIYKKGFFCINTNGDKIKGPFNDTCDYKSIYINHYAAKSLEEQELKAKKGFGKTKLKHCNHDINDIYDDTLLLISEKIRKPILDNRSGN